MEGHEGDQDSLNNSTVTEISIQTPEMTFLKKTTLT
jgi:hypothetical protein